MSFQDLEDSQLYFFVDLAFNYPPKKWRIIDVIEFRNLVTLKRRLAKLRLQINSRDRRITFFMINQTPTLCLFNL